MNHDLQTYENIFFFTNGAIGDFLMTMLSAEEVRKKASSGECTIFVPRSAPMLQGLCEGYPQIRVQAMNWRMLPLLGVLVLKNMSSKNLVVRQGVFKKSPWPTEILARLLSLRPMSRYVRFLQDEHQSPERGVVFNPSILVYENLVRLMRAGGVEIPPEVPMYHFKTDEGVLKQQGLVSSAYLVVHPAAFSSVRSLPPSRWASLLGLVAKNNPALKIVVTGSAQDRAFIQKFLPQVPQAHVVNLAGSLSMSELAQVILSARGFVGVDTGITHLAGVLRQKSVVIGNLSNPCWLPRYNKNAIILAESKNCTCDGEKGGDCFYRQGDEKYYKCLLDISDETIVREIDQMIEKNV